MNESTNKLKQSAIHFLEFVASGKVREAFGLYVNPDFIHHNAFFKGDRQTIIEAMEENARINPDKILEVKNTLEDGNLVAVHSHIRQHAGDRGAAVVHIFRFEENMIVEIWDVAMAIPEEQVNENGVF